MSSSDDTQDNNILIIGNGKKKIKGILKKKKSSTTKKKKSSTKKKKKSSTTKKKKSSTKKKKRGRPRKKAVIVDEDYDDLGDIYKASVAPLKSGVEYGVMGRRPPGRPITRRVEIAPKRPVGRPRTGRTSRTSSRGPGRPRKYGMEMADVGDELLEKLLKEKGYGKSKGKDKLNSNSTDIGNVPHNGMVLRPGSVFTPGASTPGINQPTWQQEQEKKIRKLEEALKKKGVSDEDARDAIAEAISTGAPSSKKGEQQTGEKTGEETGKETDEEKAKKAARAQAKMDKENLVWNKNRVSQLNGQITDLKEAQIELEAQVAKGKNRDNLLRETEFLLEKAKTELDVYRITAGLNAASVYSKYINIFDEYLTNENQNIAGLSIKNKSAILISKLGSVRKMRQLVIDVKNSKITEKYEGAKEAIERTEEAKEAIEETIEEAEEEEGEVGEEGAGSFLSGLLPNKMPKYIGKIVSTHSSWEVVSVKVMRTPIYPVIEKVANALTFGKMKQKMKKRNIDNFFHLFMVVMIKDKKSGKTKRFYYEKNERVEMKEIMINRKPQGEYQLMPVLVRGGIKFIDFVLNGEKSGGKLHYIYDVERANCQKFVTDVLKGNKLLNGKLNNFINQDFKNVVNSSIFRTARIATDLSAIGKRLMGKGVE
jgi:hypothetical protein